MTEYVEGNVLTASSILDWVRSPGNADLAETTPSDPSLVLEAPDPILEEIIARHSARLPRVSLRLLAEALGVPKTSLSQRLAKMPRSTSFNRE